MIELDKIKRIINYFRDICFEENNSDIQFIPKHKYDNRFKKISYQPDLNAEVVTKHEDVVELLHKVISTPRELKNILRRTWRTWEALHGECDLDDILVANAIRYSNPYAFNFILLNIDILRKGDSKSELEDLVGKENKPTALQKLWEEYFENIPWGRSALYKLIVFLFPFVGNDYDDYYIISSQRFQNTLYTDYWTRYLVEEIEQSKIRDQEILLLINKIKENKYRSQIRGKTVHHILYDSNDFAQKFEQFASNNLNTDQIRAISSNLFSLILKTERSKAKTFETSGFMELAVISSSIEHERTKYEEWFLVEMSKSLPISLLFSKGLFTEWNDYRNNNRSGEGEYNINLRRKVLGLTKSIYNSPNKLIGALNIEYPTTIKHYIKDIGMRNNKWVINLEEWNWLGNLLLESTKIGSRGILFIAYMIFDLVPKSTIKPEKYKVNFDRKFANAIFGDKLENILLTLTTTYDSDESKSDKDKLFEELYTKEAANILKFNVLKNPLGYEMNES